MSSFSFATLLNDARLLAQQPVLVPSACDDLQSRLEKTRGVLQGSTVVALGLLSAARGDLPQARELLRSLCWLPREAVSEAAREHAFHWLLTDAAARGDWLEVSWLTDAAGVRVLTLLSGKLTLRVDPLAPDSPLVTLLRELSQRAMGQTRRALSPDVLRRLSREALELEARFATATRTTPRTPTTLAELLEQVATLPVRVPPARLDALAVSAKTLLASRALRDRLFERTVLTGGGEPDAALDEVRELLDAELTSRLVDAAALTSPELKATAAARRTELIEEMHLRLDKLTDLIEQRRAPPMTEVWREFVAIRRLWERAAALSEANDRGWPHHVGVRLMRYFGTWLRLTKQQLPFARAVFDFLAWEAHVARDDASRDLALASVELCAPLRLD